MKKLTCFLVTCLFAGAAIAQPSEEDQPNRKNKKGKGLTAEEQAALQAAKNAAPAKSEVRKVPAAPAAPKQEKRKAQVTTETSETPVAKKQKNRPAPDADQPSAEAVARKQANKARTQAEKAANANQASEPVAPAPDAAKTERKKANREAAQAAREKSNREAAQSEKSGDAAKTANDQRGDQGKNKRNGKEKNNDNNQSTDARADSQPVANADRPRVRKTEAKRPAPEKIQEIRTRNENFRAEARPDRVPTVTFSESRRIENSDRWQGPQYEVFRNYRPERHDQQYYRSRYDRVELIGGGYYYFSNNYWYPAWGYQPQSEYYAYDGPVYASKRAVPPDRIIADVQASLQELGYYKGEVDGLLGPLTRAALTGYQDDEGLEITAAIDESTIDQLGLN